ncbi:hypothetical protein Tco_1433388 [Tanacetum coccineum]
MNYVPVVTGNQTNDIAGTRDNIVTCQAEKKTKPEQEYILIPFCITDPLISQGPKDSEEDSGMKPTEVDVCGASDKDGEDDQATRSEFERLLQLEKQPNSTNSFNTIGTPVSAAGSSFTNDDPSSLVNVAEDVGAAADLNNLETTMNVSPIPTTRIDKDHPKDQIIGDFNSTIQTRRMTKISNEHAMVHKKSLCDEFEAEILKKFDFATMKTTSTPIETNKVLVKDEEAEATDVHLYRSMIRSLMYLTASRPDIMFAVCACARYLKGQPKLGLWYPIDSPFDLEAFSKSDYAGASLDRKSTTREYVAAANCCGQNPVFHSKTKHTDIRHHFIRDSYEKKLIQVIKIHIDHNVADLLTKAFDVSRFNFLIASIGLLNL